MASRSDGIRVRQWEGKLQCRGQYKFIGIRVHNIPDWLTHSLL